VKRFEQHQLKEARAYASEGGQALHVHRFTLNGHRLFRRYPEAAHLFDRDPIRLAATAARLGVRVIKIEKLGTESQHVDLCAKPLARAKALCEGSFL
jgi:hypothetical protein